jgi:hypothetical protein
MDGGYFQQLYVLQASIKQNIKEHVPAKKSLSKAQMLELVRFNLSVLDTPPAKLVGPLEHLASKPDTLSLIPMAVNLLMSDLAFDKFGIEEEDQIKSLKRQELAVDSDLH